MSVKDVLATLRPLAVATPITRANVNELLDKGQIEVHMLSGKWWAIRRNGATLTWKRDAGRIRIPYKYGLKGYGQITEIDFSDRAIAPQSLDPMYFRVKPAPELR